MSNRPANTCVQAAPDCALVFIVDHVSGAPDAERWAVGRSVFAALPSNLI